MHRIQKFFWSNDFLLSVLRDLIHNFAQKVSLALSRAFYVLIQEDELNYFKFPSWVAGTILEGLEAELDITHSFMFQF